MAQAVFRVRLIFLRMGSGTLKALERHRRVFPPSREFFFVDTCSSSRVPRRGNLGWKLHSPRTLDSVALW